MFLKVGDKVLVKESFAGQFTHMQGEEVSITLRNIDDAEGWVRGGLAAKVGTFPEPTTEGEDKPKDEYPIVHPDSNGPGKRSSRRSTQSTEG